MQKSSSVSLSSLKSIFVLASQESGFIHLSQACLMLCTQSWCEKNAVSCCALNSDVKRMLSWVMHSILMRKQCYNLAKKMSGFCTSHVVCIAASCCALSPHVGKKMLSTAKKTFFISTWNHMGAHPSEVYFWITLSCIILCGREGGTRICFCGRRFWS